MNKISTKKLNLLIAKYIDNELNDKDKEMFESLLDKDIELKKRVEEIKKLKVLLTGKNKLPIDLGFWSRLSTKLEQKQKASIPYRRRLVPAFVTIAVIGIGIYILQIQYKIFDFSSDKTQTSQSKNEKVYSNKSLVPIFSKVDKDKALQFSLFGSIPLDEESETSLRIDDQLDKGYRIEVGKGSQSKMKQVTFDKFVEEIKPTQEQKKIIDSLLELTGKHIESSVLIGDNNIMAIAPDLPKLNKIMFTNLTSCLEPQQRERMGRFLQSSRFRRRTDMQILSEDINQKVLQDIPRLSQGEHFIIITPDTLIYSQLNIDFDSLQKQMNKDIEIIRSMRERMLKKMMQKDNRYSRRQITSPWNVQVSSGDEFFSIEIVPQDTDRAKEKVKTMSNTEKNEAETH